MSRRRSKEVKEAEAPAAAEAEAEHIETKSPKVAGPNVLGKINLDEMNMASRPKKGAKKKTEEAEAETPATEEKKPVKKSAKKKEEPVTPPVVEQPKVEPAPEVIEEDEKPEHIEMKAPKLEGPKIIGRIELPVDNASKGGDSKEKRNQFLACTMSQVDCSSRHPRWRGRCRERT